MKIAVLGNKGMLGSMVEQYLHLHIEGVHGFNRATFDATRPNLSWLDRYEWVVNCIGTIKPRVDQVGIEDTIKINSLFPHYLAGIAQNLIHITTDCVYSGQRGMYRESDPHDALDIYGKTKSLGEPYGDNVRTLRCSILGPGNKDSLFDWFMAQSGSVKGFKNHYWNGITTLHFARICRGIIESGCELDHVQHLIPSDARNKADLLDMLADYFRKDVVIEEIQGQATDRTLATDYGYINDCLWTTAGYIEPPSIEMMIAELSEYMEGGIS
jgi:dTDP-4-dehydrorhamnose reductase